MATSHYAEHPDVCVYLDCEGARERLVVNTWRNDTVRFEIDMPDGAMLVDLDASQIPALRAQLDEWLHANHLEPK